MIRNVVAVGPVVVWVGKPERTPQRVARLAGWRPRFPTLAALRLRLGDTGPPAPGDEAEWSGITVTRVVDGTPVARTEYIVSPSGALV